MTKTLSERIAEYKQDIIDSGRDPEHDVGFQLIEELGANNHVILAHFQRLQAENQALLSKNEKLENLCEKERDVSKKLCTRNSDLDSANVALEAKVEVLQKELAINITRTGLYFFKSGEAPRLFRPNGVCNNCAGVFQENQKLQVKVKELEGKVEIAKEAFDILQATFGWVCNIPKVENSLFFACGKRFRIDESHLPEDFKNEFQETLQNLGKMKEIGDKLNKQAE